ncbi:MAG: hypothetical protein WAV38_32980, partial [Xanthobacteraceae bacterium]
QTGSMIAGDDQLELRDVIEKVLPHKSRRDRITVGCESRNSALGPGVCAWFNYREVSGPINTFADSCSKNSADFGRIKGLQLGN